MDEEDWELDMGPNVSKELVRMFRSNEANSKWLSKILCDIKEESCPADRKGLEFLRDNLAEWISVTNKDILQASKKNNKDEQSELLKNYEYLEGTMCQAPFASPDDDSQYYNAIIAKVEVVIDASTDLVMVRVFFTNPVLKQMVPCKYYFNGTCRFHFLKCRYSHGYIVSLSDLRKYREPDFKAVAPGTKALVKQLDQVWAPATILAVNSYGWYNVKFERNGRETMVELHDILPTVSPDKEEGCFVFNMERSSADESMIQKSLPNPPAVGFGEWEKHTKGIGSRLMAKMGYIPGTGLGKHADGRVDPVEAVVLPAGKSLDHCMYLKERAKDGGDGNLLNLNRKLEKLEKRGAKQITKQNDEPKETKNVFQFLNDHLSGQPSPSTTKIGILQTSPIPGPSNLKTQSSRNLNISSLQISEDIRRAEKSLAHIRESLSRHSEGSVTYRKLLEKYDEKKEQIQSLKTSETVINKERNQRSDYKKMKSFKF